MKSGQNLSAIGVMTRMSMSTTSRHGLELLSCARVGLTLTECMKDDRERLISRSLSTLTDYRQVTSRHLARQRTIDRLVWDYRSCLENGATDDVCGRDLRAYRSCLDAGKFYRQCETELPE